MFKNAFDLWPQACLPLFMLFVILALIFINRNDTFRVETFQTTLD